MIYVIRMLQTIISQIYVMRHNRYITDYIRSKIWRQTANRVYNSCVFSVYLFPLWWLREYIYIYISCLIIIKYEVWTIIHCLGLGHETMACAVCLSIFLASTLLQPARDTAISLSISGKNGHHFNDDIFKCIYVYEKLCMRNQISLNFVDKSLIDKKSALVQVKTWHRTGDKPLPELMLTRFTDAYMRQ